MLKKLTIDQLLKESAEKHSSNIALADVKGNSLTYKELFEKVQSIQNFLKDEGILPGDKIAILSENSINWAVAYFAITTMGAVGVPIMTDFQAVEVKHIIRHSESKAIFVSSKQYDKIEECESEELTTRILLDDFSIIPSGTESDIIKRIKKEGYKGFNKIKFAAMQFVGWAEKEINEDTLALIFYTSGTTGHSKGVMLLHRNVVYDAYATTVLVDLSENDKMLSILPLYHTIESTLGLLTPIMIGASVYYLDKPPTAAALLPALGKVKPTVMISVPLVIEKIYKMRILPEINKKTITRVLYKFPIFRKKINEVAGKKLLKTFGGNLRMLSIGGAALAPDVERFLFEAHFPYAIGYGLTETSPLVTGTGPKRVRFRASGIALKGMEVKIDNPNPQTGEGEVLIKGPNVMKGYYKDPDKTKEVLPGDGWFRSGDLGVIDSDGYLFIKGRSKNVIIGSNGKNIYPEEIESIINEQPYVLESIVLNRDGKLVARIHLNYEELDNQLLNKLTEAEAREEKKKIFDEILKKVNERVNKFSKISEIIEQSEPFAKTPTQKIKRFLYD